MKTKLLLPITIAALACSASAQNLEKKVTFEEPAGTADHVLSDLSNAAGVKLTADSEMSREVLLISVNDAPLKELLERIARVTSGRWVTDHGAMGLVPDRQKREAEAIGELRARTEALRGLIKNEFDREPAKLSGTDSQSAPEPPQRTRPQGPIRALILQIDPAVVAELGPNQRVVYSSNPTASQLPLPTLSPDEVNAAIARHNNTAAEVAKNPETQEERQAREYLESMGLGDEGRNRITAQPATILFTVANDTTLGQYPIDLRFYDRAGRVIFHSSRHLFDPEGRIANVMDAAGQEKSETAGTPKGQPITFSPETLEVITLSGGDSMAKQPKLSEGLLQKLLHPEKFDPLSFIPTEGLLALAHNRHEQLVADLPDSTALPSDSVGKGTTDSSYLREISSVSGGVTSFESGGWVQISPREPSAARAKRLDRDALRELIAASHSKGVPSLDDIAKYALRAEPPDSAGPDVLYLPLFAPSILFGDFLRSNDWNTLRFYGLMDATQKASLRDGGALPVQSLSPSQIALVHEMAYGADGHLEVHRPGDQPKPANPMFDMASEFMPQVQTDTLQEPTESLAGGLPPDSTLKVGFSDETVIKPIDKGGGMMGMFSVLGVTEYSLYRYLTEQPSESGMMPEAPKIDKMKVGRRAVYTFTFRFSPLVTLTRKLTDDQFAADAATVGVAALPREFLDAVASRMAEFKKLSSIFEPSMLGGAGKPAP